MDAPPTPLRMSPAVLGIVVAALLAAVPLTLLGTRMFSPWVFQHPKWQVVGAGVGGMVG